MIRTGHMIRLCLFTAMLMASAMLVASCSLVEENEDELIYVPLDDHDDFQLRFQICTRTLNSSRVADISGDEEGSGAENFINLNDIRYYIFDKDGNFLLDLTPYIDHDRSFTLSNDYSLYEVVAKIDNKETSYFKDNRSGTVDFYIMAFANYSRDSGYGDVTLPDFKKGNTLLQMFESPFSPVIDCLPNTEKLMKAAEKTDAGNRNCFPMAGLQRFTLSGTWFATQAGEVPIDITSITGKSLNMLRALAKIEIIDRINLKPGVKYADETDNKKIRITNATLNGVMKTARIIPTINQWNRKTFETQQVENASVTGLDSYMMPPPLNADGSISTDETGSETSDQCSLQFVYDAAETKKREDLCRVYSCYVWEYLLLDKIPTNQLPYLSVTVKNSDPLESGTTAEGVIIPTTTTYNMQLMTDMAPDAKDPEPQKSILRNHIYRYEISGAGAKLTIKWSVCPMDKVPTDITLDKDLTDITFN